MSRIAESMLGAVYGTGAGFKAEGTARAAADAVAVNLKERQREVLAVYERAGKAGLTADEAALLIGRSVLAVRPRVTELKELGLLEATGERRRNDSGMAAAVHRRTR